MRKVFHIVGGENAGKDDLDVGAGEQYQVRVRE